MQRLKKKGEVIMKKKLMQEEKYSKPVIMTKKELDNLVEGTITTIVDNQVAKENVSKLAQSLGLEFSLLIKLQKMNIIFI